jgi:hypothetical protein
VLVDAQRALGIIGAHVRLVNAHERRAVTVREVLITRCTHDQWQCAQWKGHEFKIKHCCDINEDAKTQRDTTKREVFFELTDVDGKFVSSLATTQRGAASWHEPRGQDF